MQAATIVIFAVCLLAACSVNSSPAIEENHVTKINAHSDEIVITGGIDEWLRGRATLRIYDTIHLGK